MARPKPGQLRKALRARLSGAIMSDWTAAVGVMDGGHVRGDTDARVHRRRPRDMAGSTERWGSVCEMDGDKCIPQPRWLDATT